MPAPTNADSDSGVSRMRSSPNSSSRPLLTANAAAIAADVLAHQEHARIALHRAADRFAHGFAIRDRRHAPSATGAMIARRAFCASSAIHESGDLFDRLQRAGARECNRRVDLRIRFRFDRREIVVTAEPRRFEPLHQRFHRAALFPPLDLGLVAVQLGVEHRMRAEAIRAELEEHRARSGANARHRAWRRVFGLDHVHAVDGFRRHAVAAAFAWMSVSDSERSSAVPIA